MAQTKTQFVRHKRSSVVTDGAPKLPTASQLDLGEIAINFAEGYETLSIKNSNSGITTFSSDSVLDTKYVSSGTVAEMIESSKFLSLSGGGIVTGETTSLMNKTITPSTEINGESVKLMSTEVETGVGPQPKKTTRTTDYCTSGITLRQLTRIGSSMPVESSFELAFPQQFIDEEKITLSAVYDVHFLADESGDETVYTMDKTFDEIYSAYTTGREVRLYTPFDGILTLKFAEEHRLATWDSHGTDLVLIEIYPDDSIVYSYEENTMPSSVSDLENDLGFITGYTETDPTVPAWAKASTKPTYTASEVGAMATSERGNYLSTGATLDSVADGTTRKLSDYSLTGHTHSEYSSTGHSHTAAEVGALSTATTYFDDVEYDSSSKRINFKKNSTVIDYVDATDFIKDGMVSSVTVSNGNLVLTFNTDAGREDITLALTQIFNPNNYYDKDTADGKFLSGYTETDPTVPSWAKESTKPSYTASEVGAMATSERSNYLPTGATLDSVADGTTRKLSNYSLTGHSHTASEIGALPTGTTLDGIADGTTRKLSNYSLTSHTHTAAEVGALPDTTDIPTQASIANSGFTKNIGTLTGVTINGSAATVSNGNASFNIELGGSGSGLPAVTSTDNGKILQVVNGQWALVTPTVIYTGNGTPDSALGNNGDIYLQTS